MNVAALSPLAHEVLNDLFEHPRTRAEHIAQRLGQPTTEIYAGLVQLHDQGLARIENLNKHPIQRPGRARLWIPA